MNTNQEIDPLYRVFVPIEGRALDGTVTFRTTDREEYRRLPDGSIRLLRLKVNGKAARKARRQARCRP
jgi:hypothetical protein